jgi:DNA polymerase III alpha subunit
MPSLELEYADVSDREKASWEKELLGISFSKTLFDPRKLNTDATLCGQIDSDMNGENVTVICEVASVAQLFTRKDGSPFVKATVEDISGSIEAMVWPNVYGTTRELWQEGNLLQLEATVRIRDDEVQLSVNSAGPHNPGAVQTEEVAAIATEETPQKIEEPAPEPVPTNNRMLVISMTQTSDKESDLARLHKLNAIIKEFPGVDEVILRVENGGKVDRLKLSSTGYCPELHQRLAELVGEERLRLETLTS